ncbi:ATP-dependent helicase [Fulvia fulva]|uniref:ATP-dependent helicase n=1 Tax=Passalora fulva TaxID=5499 RepID=A0A9Q8LCU3_PASFU|nr:ATP-dependent helicase [Fulvia fulva]KAK4630593.1 ATP-dependent helicase [Fulvia fulva]UJO15097.1 ATP-dependent helicase [Fulvia fulva]
MVKLQAATDRPPEIVRKPKRKRQTPAPQTDDTNDESTTDNAVTTVPTKTHDGGKKPRRSKKNADAPTLERNNSSTVVESSIPWPAEFTQLAQVHRALNLVYTFCCTRKHFATTIENLRSTVEANLKRELKNEDVAKIKLLIPLAVDFLYVDQTLLEIQLMGEEDLRGKKAAGDMFMDSPAEVRNVKEGLGKEEHQDVLFFEFVDGELRRQVADPLTGEPINAYQKIRKEDLKMPVFSQKTLMKLIDKRNVKFTSAINGWLNECAEKSADPVQRLEEEHKQYIPQPPQSRQNTPPELSKSTLPASIPEERKHIPEIIEELKGLEWYTGQIVPDGHRVFDPQQPVYGELNFSLSQDLVDAMYNTKSITSLYSHQAEAINALQEGQNVIVSTSTSSGKSLIYQLPVLHTLETEPQIRAMYIFPTKALAQDQRRSLKAMLSYMPELSDVVCETFDGDTSFPDRNYIRDEARIIFTNPDMLHLTILPQEEAWRTFLKNLRYVVMDELHVYNGLFGAHVALIMRRLRRICAAVGNRNVKFISCSATVANPEEHMRTIFGIEDVKLIDFDGSPCGRKEFLCWNTPYKDPADPTSGRGDSFIETARLFCQLILRGVRVICFCRIRKFCEILTTAIKNELNALGRAEVMNRVMAYRGGYTPQDRRRIEKEMFEGKLVGIIGTSALELGVDIGSLDCVISHGFPYTIANLRQQSGRAGRRNKDSLSVLVGNSFPTDQYFMANPDEIFTRPNCELQVDLTNVLVLEGHIQCAAYEMPISADEDDKWFSKQLPEICSERLRKDDLGFYHPADRFLPYPSRTVAIRDTEDDHFAIVDMTNGRNVVLEELETSRAFFTIYEGGIHIHQGNKYLVKHVDTERMIAKVEFVKVDWITQQRDYTDIDPVETEAVRRIPDSMSRAFFGTIKIHQNVFGFFKLDKKNRILDAVQVDNPPIIIFSKGMWLDVPKQAVEILNSRRLNVAAGIHAAEHALLSLMPNFVISMPGDVKTECKVAVKEFAKKESKRKRPARLTFYDDKGGQHGSGIAAKAFEFIDLLLHQAHDRVEACHCLEGCLECCCSERCKEANQVMSKAGCEVILKSLLNKEIDVDNLPWGPEDERVPAGIETVMLAEEIRPRAGRHVEVIEVKREGGGIRRVVVGEEGDVIEETNDDEVVVIKDEPEDE